MKLSGNFVFAGGRLMKVGKKKDIDMSRANVTSLDGGGQFSISSFEILNLHELPKYPVHVEAEIELRNGFVNVQSISVSPADFGGNGSAAH